jgi:hypothetical protein
VKGLKSRPGQICWSLHLSEDGLHFTNRVSTEWTNDTLLEQARQHNARLEAIGGIRRHFAYERRLCQTSRNALTPPVPGREG